MALLKLCIEEGSEKLMFDVFISHFEAVKKDKQTKICTQFNTAFRLSNLLVQDVLVYDIIQEFTDFYHMFQVDPLKVEPFARDYLEKIYSNFGIK